MNTKHLSFLLLAALAFAAGPLHAATATANGVTWTYVVSNGKATIGDGSLAIPKSTSGALNIPSSIGGYPVTAIAEDAFRSCGEITSATIPDSVTTIGASAFDGCSGLTSVTVGTGVTSVDYRAFNGCSSLAAVRISDLAAWCRISFNQSSAQPLRYAGHLYLNGTEVTSLSVPSGVTAIGAYAFYGCSRLTSVAIPVSVTSIGDYAFEGCSSITAASADPKWAGRFPSATRFTIPSGVKTIGASAFSGRSGLTSITIPDSVRSIGDNAFYDCSGLTSITIPDSVTRVGQSAFSGCSGLTDPVYSRTAFWYVPARFSGSFAIPDGVSIVGDFAFSGCSRLTSVTIPDSVTSIGDYAFSGCSGLTDITIPNSVTRIGRQAFYGCSGLTSLVIPDSVTSIGVSAFDDCSRLKSIVIGDGVSSLASFAFQVKDYYGNIVSRGYPALTNLVIGNGVRMLPDGVFSNYSSLVSVEIGSGVTSIGGCAFQYCSGLRSITIPEGVTSIGSSAFYDCSGLTSITIPNSVTNIGDSAFVDCSGLTSVMIGSGVTSIGYWAFGRCSSLGHITIPNSVTHIGNDAFHGCSELTSVSIPNGVTYIEGGTFFDCSSLASVTIPNGVTWIGSQAFSGCFGLASVSIPDSVTNIGHDAFPVTVFDGVSGVLLVDGWAVGGSASGDLDLTGFRGIAYWAFKGCSELTSVTIPDTVTGIGRDAFDWCENLKSTRINISDMAKWTTNAINVNLKGTRRLFIGNEEMTSFSIPDGVTNIGDYAFSGCSGLTSVTIPDGVTSIGDYAFSGCSGLTSVTIPDSVTSIGHGAFSGCSRLTSVTIPDGVTSIGNTAFSGCSELTSVSIPDSVTSIGNNAFYGCSDALFDTNSIPGAKLVDGWAVGYADSLSGDLDLTGVRGIAPDAFYYCYRLTSVTVDDMTIIMADAFSLCYYLSETRIHLSDPSTWTTNAINANLKGTRRLFVGDEELTSFSIPDGVTSIGDYAFSGCSGLTSITIPDGVTSIGDYAFSGCSGLTSVTIPDGVTSIGDYAFSGCSGLTSVTIPDSVTSIEGGLFGDCFNLKEVHISDLAAWCGFPDNFLHSYRLFLNGEEIKDLVIPDGVTSIGHGAFSGCSGLTSVTIPDGVTSIGAFSFSGCSELTSVTIPDGVTSIGEYAFYDCFGLTSVTIPSSTKNIGDNAFKDCYRLSTLYLPNSFSGSLRGCPSGCTIVYYDFSLSIHSPVVKTVPGLEYSVFWWNDIVSCSVDSPVLDGDYRYVCKGWTGTGSVPASGTSNRVDVLMLEDSSITWLWEKQQHFDNVVSGGADVWFGAETNAPWTATADATATDGFSLRSGEVAQGGASALEATVTGPSRLSFAWKIAANRNDYARFYVDGAKQAEIARSTDWTTVSLELGEGEHALRWAFERGSAAGGAAFLDDLLWIPFHSLAVASTDGTPTPAAGTHTLDWGMEVAASVSPPAAANGTRHVCTGWTGTGSVPASGTGTNVTFTLKEDSSITWNWRTEHWIDVAVTGGTTDFEPQWIPDGEESYIYLSPNWTRYDLALSGDTNGVTVRGTRLTIPADGPRTIRATITERKMSLTVSTPMGEVSPAPGTYEHSYGDSITASAVSPFSERNGVQVACAGWTGTGNVPSSGTGTSRTFTITQDSSITWKWTTNVWIDVTVTGGGTTSFSPQWVRKGTTATVSLSPDWTLYDIALSGDTEGVTRDGRHLYVPADEPRTIRATIAERKVSLAVSSAFGTAAPSVGTQLHSWGDTVNASVAAPPETDGTRTVCTGWTGTGSVPASGTGSAVSFTMQEDSTLSWRWRTDHWISVETAGPVETDFREGWLAEGETLEVACDVLYEGDCELTLGGDTNGVVLDATARMLSIPCDGPRSIVLAAQPTVEEELTLATALDAPKLVWTSEGANAWTPQTATTADGEDAAASGAAGSAGGGDSLLATTLSGPGTLSWSWRLETAGGSGIDLLIDGATPRYIEGDRAGAWVDASVAIAGAGTHEVQFVFWNEMGAAADRAYLDLVSWTGAVAGGDTTAMTPEPVPHEWLVSHGLAAAGASAAAFEAAANAKSANGRPVWECYVAGLDPTKNEDFRAAIDLDGGEPVVTWWPSNVAGRAYTVWGKSNLADEWAHPVKPAHRFFQVRVAVGSASGVDERAWPGSVEVAFDPAGGTVNPATRTYDAPGALGELPVPTKAGHDFLGWWTRETGGVPVDAGMSVPWCDWTLYARWRPIYSVQFEAADGTGTMADQTFFVGTPQTLSTNRFEREGYDFVGWANESGGAAVYDDGEMVLNLSSMPGARVTLWAVWRARDPLAQALNPDLNFTKGGDAEWFAESEDTHDGVAAARSGAITHSQSTWIETTVTGAGTVSFWWKVSSESGYDYLRFYVDGSQQTSVSGTSSDWSQKTFTVSGSGSHTLRWTYSKDGSVSSGSDCGWVDEVVWTPAE